MIIAHKQVLNSVAGKEAQEWTEILAVYIIKANEAAENGLEQRGWVKRRTHTHTSQCSQRYNYWTRTHTARANAHVQFNY